MGKVLFFDIDGTLYDFNGRMPDSTRKALALAKENGHEIVICSGRAMFQIYPELREIADGLVTLAGARVDKGEQTIFHYHMPEETVKLVTSVLRTSGGAVAAMIDEHLWMNDESYGIFYRKYARNGKDIERVKKYVIGEKHITDDLNRVRDISKFLYENASWDVDEVQAALKGFCDVTASSFRDEVRDSGEISGAGINKALGMEKYLQFIGKTREDSIAFGDGPNDIEMLQYAGISVAMGSGRPEAKAAADIVAPGVSEDGIYRAMEKMKLI